VSASLRLRLTVAVVGVVAIGLLVLAIALYVAVRRAAWAQHDRGLGERARTLAALVEYDADDGYELELAGAEAAGLGAPGRDAYFEVWAPDGTVIARSSSLAGADLPAPAARAGALRFADVALPDGAPGRLVAIRVVAFTESEAAAARAGEVTIALAEGTGDVRATLATVRRWFWGIGGATLALIALIAAAVVSRALRPLPRLGAALERIDDRRLDARLSVDDQPAELQAPVRTLNALLARLEASFARERRFTADVSHELRTPLAGLRTLLDVTALRDRSGDDYRRALAEAGAIVEQLGALVENLLMLARLDAGQLPVAREPVVLRALVEECWARHAALARRRGVTFRDEVDETAVIETDREKLRLVIGNLLGNAAEYTEAGGWIAVTAATAPGVVLDVTDSGPPIPAEHLQVMFDRLWRGEAARSGGGVHCGIGLALARAVCDALHCHLTATTLDDGRVRLRITASDSLIVPSSSRRTIAA